jgi:hypothetical protein
LSGIFKLFVYLLNLLCSDGKGGTEFDDLVDVVDAVDDLDDIEGMFFKEFEAFINVAGSEIKNVDGGVIISILDGVVVDRNNDSLGKLFDVCLSIRSICSCIELILEAFKVLLLILLFICASEISSDSFILYTISDCRLLILSDSLNSQESRSIENWEFSADCANTIIKKRCRYILNTF